MTEIGQETALVLEHRYAAPREQVFDAWVNPEVLKRWWAAAPTWSTPLAEVDAREGGAYRLSMKTDEGEVHTVQGEYTEFRPPERLAYTWEWDEGPEHVTGGERSLVIVDFVDDGDGTIVKLLHKGIPNEQIREMHAHGLAGRAREPRARGLLVGGRGKPRPYSSPRSSHSARNGSASRYSPRPSRATSSSLTSASRARWTLEAPGSPWRRRYSPVSGRPGSAASACSTSRCARAAFSQTRPKCACSERRSFASAMS